MKGRGRTVVRVFVLSLLSILIPFALLFTSSSVAKNSSYLVYAAQGGSCECPAPTVYQDGKCVLESDARLAKALRLSSSMTLDCREHRIFPSAVGMDDNPKTKANENKRSVPEVGVFLNSVSGVTIENCEIDGFDWGVLGIDYKLTEVQKNDAGILAETKHKIRSNTIRARYAGILTLKFDNMETADNTVIVSSPGGWGIAAWVDSDLHKIRNNTVHGIATADDAPQAPGLYNEGVYSDWFIGVTVVQLGGPFVSALMNVIIEGELYQIAPALGKQPEDGVIEGNTVVLNPAIPQIGILLHETLNSKVSGNTVSGAEMAIINNDRPDRESRQLAGTCSEDPERLCLKNGDCSIPGIDTVPKGHCVLPAPEPDPWDTYDSVIEGNTVTDFNLRGIAVNGWNTEVRDNVIKGSQSQAGMNLTRQAMLTATVTRNQVSGVKHAIILESGADFYGAAVTLNDFVSRSGILLTAGYNTPADLSSAGRGNYWGRSCGEGDGFLDADEPGRGNKTDSPSLVVTDSNPYGEAVAAKSAEELDELAPCP